MAVSRHNPLDVMLCSGEGPVLATTVPVSSLTFYMVDPDGVSGSTRPSVGMTEYAANPCWGEARCFGNRGDGVAVRERSSNRCVPHATRQLKLLADLGKLCGVQGDVAERICDHTVTIIQTDLN